MLQSQRADSEKIQLPEQADYYSKEFDGDTYAFTEKFYEDSPLNRTDSTYNTGRGIQRGRQIDKIRLHDQLGK